MTLTKPTPSVVDGLKWKFNTVSDMRAEDRLLVGDKVETLGYLNPGDGGGATYEIVAAATGTDDGGSYHDLTGISGQAKLLHNGIIHAEQFGAVDGVEASAEIQAAWYTLYTWQQANGADYQTWLFHNSRVTIQNQIEFKASGGGTTDFMNFDLRGSSWTATTGGDLTTSVAMLKVRSTQAVQYFGYLNGNKSVACLDFFGVAGSRAFYPEVRNFKGYGIRVRGSAGSFALYAPLVSEYQQSDAEYTTQANYTARGIQVSEGDWNCYNANVLWCNECVRFGNDPDDAAADPPQVHFVEGHFVSGNVVDGAANPFTDGVLVANYASRENHLDSCYFDNGVVNDYTASLHVNGGHWVNNAAATLVEPKLRIWSDSAAKGSAPNLRITGIGGLASIGFQQSGGDTWAGQTVPQSDMYSGMSDENTTVQAVQTEYKIYTAQDVPSTYSYKLSGSFTQKYQQGTDVYDIVVNPSSDTVSFSGSVSFNGGLTRGGPVATLTIASGSITPVNEAHRIDTEGGAGTDDLTTISTTNAVAGDRLTLFPSTGGRTITVKHGTGNIQCGSDRVLNSIHDTIDLVFFNSNWRMVSYSDNA